ncbi:MAG: hypothetical protein ACR2IS_10720, partial [Nitrososphaeraceae archaeon]
MKVSISNPYFCRLPFVVSNRSSCPCFTGIKTYILNRNLLIRSYNGHSRSKMPLNYDKKLALMDLIKEKGIVF